MFPLHSNGASGRGRAKRSVTVNAALRLPWFVLDSYHLEDPGDSGYRKEVDLRRLVF